MHKFEHNRKLLKHLYLLHGQLNGIEKIMLNDRSHEDVTIQLSSVECSYYTFFSKDFFKALQKDVAAHLTQLLDKYSDCLRLPKTLDTIHENLGSYTLFPLPLILKLLCEIDQFGEKYKPE